MTEFITGLFTAVWGFLWAYPMAMGEQAAHHLFESPTDQMVSVVQYVMLWAYVAGVYLSVFTITRLLKPSAHTSREVNATSVRHRTEVTIQPDWKPRQGRAVSVQEVRSPTFLDGLQYANQGPGDSVTTAEERDLFAQIVSFNYAEKISDPTVPEVISGVLPDDQVLSRQLIRARGFDQWARLHQSGTFIHQPSGHVLYANYPHLAPTCAEVINEMSTGAKLVRICAVAALDRFEVEDEHGERVWVHLAGLGLSYDGQKRGPTAAVQRRMVSALVGCAHEERPWYEFHTIGSFAELTDGILVPVLESEPIASQDIRRIVTANRARVGHLSLNAWIAEVCFLGCTEAHILDPDCRAIGYLSDVVLGHRRGATLHAPAVGERAAQNFVPDEFTGTPVPATPQRVEKPVPFQPRVDLFPVVPIRLNPLKRALTSTSCVTPIDDGTA